MKKIYVIALAFAFSAAAHAAEQRPLELAIESYKFLQTTEMMLQGAINGGSKADYQRFIWKPTLDQFQKWPPLTEEAYGKYRPCQFAVDAFRVYSEEQFKARGTMDKNRPYYKDYFARKQECATLLKGKV
ncbi:hypothetical protein SGO26_30190 (plasmid) [Cupriavidus metallidurans]|uniref:hypothetical protein n=1 Tax=Cupriavidus metallidurans TaxID=119219 RepID=UPI003D736E13